MCMDDGEKRAGRYRKGEQVGDGSIWAGAVVGQEEWQQEGTGMPSFLS